MNNRRLLGALLIAGIFVVPAWGNGADPANPLEPLAWAVGGKWVGEIKTADGSPMTVETVFKWADHRKAIHYTVVFKVKGKTIPQYDGTYYWHPGKKSLALLETDRGGDVTESTLKVDGPAWEQRNDAYSADGTKQEQRVELVREGDDVFAFKAFILKDGQWVKAVGFKYKRVRE